MAKKEKESPSTSLDYLHWWEDNTKPKQPHTFGNTISAIKSGIGNAYDMMDIDKELNGLWEEYNVNPNTTPERKKEIESLFVDKYKQAKALAKEQQDKVDWLQEDKGTLSQLGSHAFSAGTSLNSMVTQYGIQGTSALLGGIVGGVLATPETGGLGTLAGAKAGASAGWNASALPASMYANYNDAEQAAAAVRERVMLATGNPNLAQQAYKEALTPNLAAVAPSVIVDALTSKYIGGAIGKLAGNGAKVGKAANRMVDMMEAARQTRLARGLQRVADTPLGTMAGRAANFIDEFDLPQKAGSWVAGKTNIPALGKLTRGALQFAGEEASEVFQEGEQGVSEDIAYENALYKSDPTKYAKPEGWTANRIGNWVNSEEGRRTIVDTLVGTGLTAGLATGVSGFARLDNGYNNSNNLRNVSNLLAEQQEGGILYSADPEVNSQMKNTIGARYHLNEEQTSALSPEQVIRLSLEDESERAQASGMSAEEASTYAINKYINKRLGLAGRPDYTSEASERFFQKYGIKGTEGLTSIQKRRQEEQEVLKQQPTVAKQAHPDTFSSEPKSYIEERKAQAQGVEQEQQSKGSTGILSKLPQVWHDNWVRREVATTGTNDEYENNTALYDNKVTGKVVRITENNGQLFVADVTPKNTKDANGNPVDAAKTNKFGSPVSRGSRGGQKFTMNKKGLEALNKFFLDNKTNVKELNQESDEQQQATLPPDPNRRRVLIWSANDLANFYRNNSDLMDEDTFMKMTDVLMSYGNNNIPIDLDLERDNNGIVGQTTSEPVQQGVIRAVIHLYMGADAITVLHEFAHVGYDMKSEHEKKLFNAMAQMTQEGFVADVLRKSFNYYADKTNDEIFAMIRQAVQTKDGNVWKDIQDAGVLRQTINIINNEADPDKIQEACEERYAWEFTLWYAEGYLKGRKPDNRMTAMLQRDCRTLGKALKLIGSVAERLQSDGWQAVSGKSMVSMFEEMNNRLYETGDPNVRRTYGGLSRQVQGGYQLNPEVFNNPERRLYTNPLETAMPYSPQVTSMPMQFGTQSQMQMPYNPQTTSMPMNYGNPMENTMQQSVPQQAQSMPFGAEMQMANAYPNNTYVPNFTSNIPNFQLQSNPEEGIEGARQNLKNMSNKELIDYAESLRGVDPYSFEKQQVMEEMNRRGLSGKFARREENREVGAYTGEQTSREIMKPETIADMGEAEMNALADMLIEQYNSNLKELGRLMDTSYENAEGDPATQRFIERLRKVVFDKLYDRNRRGMPEGSRQEETKEQGEPEKAKVVVHRNKYTQVSDEEAGKILNKAEHGDEEAQKQWESLPFNQRRRVKGEADITEQQMKEQTKKAAETGKPTYTTGRQMREGLQASPFKENRPNEFSDSLENARRSGVRDIVRKISEMSPEEREKYLQDPKFEENPNYKQAKEIYLESLKPHQALRGKKDELIGRQIESVTRSKIAVEMIEEAFPDGLPSDLSEWRDITSSSNIDGERGYQIYNKLFGTKIKPDNKNVSLYVHRSGLVGCIVTNDGKAFPHVLVSNKYKQERAGLFSQMILMMHAMPKVKTLTLPTRNVDRTVLVNRLALYQRAGFDIVGFNLQDGKIYLRNSNVEGAIKTKNDKLKWKGLAVGRYKEKQKEIKLGTIPLFRTQQEMSDYYNWLSDKEEPLTRKQQENIWDSVTRSIRNFPMTSDKQLRALIKLVDNKLQTDTSSSKMLARTKLLYSLLREAAQEELNSRKGKYNYNDESTVLNNLADADELKFRRSEMVKEGNAAADQFKAQELFDDATARFTQEENEKENEPTEIEEHFAKDGIITSPKQSVAVEDISMDSFDRLIQSAKQYGIAEDLTKDLKDTFFALQESKRNDEPQEKLKDLEVKFNKLQKSFMDAMQEFSKKIEEAAEEYDKEETDAIVDEKQADKKGAPTVRVADDSLRGDITKYNYDDLCRIAMADLLVGEEGKETLYKGLSEDEYITPTEVRRIIGALARKYDSPNIEGIREGLIFRELTEQEKRQVGRVFRKLYRMKKLMDGRFKQGLYGQRGSSNSEEWHIFGHAFAFRRWFSGFYAGNAYGFNALKRIMDNNDIPMYLYAFDEKDMATPLSDEQAQQYRTRVKKITRELTTLRAKRLSEKKNAKKVEYDREIATRENERMEMMTQLWAHGKDINGDGSYSAEEDIFNRDARQRSWIRKFGYTLGRIDLKKKPRQQTTEQEQKELNEEINRGINNKPKEESPLSRKIVVNINSDNVERARIATEKRNREEQAVADKEWAEKKSAEEQELYDYMNGNQEVMSFLKKPIKKPEDILRFNAMNTIAENTSEEMFDRVEEEMDKFLEDLKQMGAFGLGNYEEDEGYKRYTQIKNKLNEQLNKVHDRITGKTQPKQTKQKKQTTATENKQTAQTNTAKQGSTIDDSVLRGRILQAIKGYYKTGEIDMKKIIYDGETVTDEQQKKIDSMLENAKKKYAEKNKGNAEPAPTPTPEPTTNKKNATSKKNKSTKTTTPTTKTTAPTTGSTTINKKTTSKKTTPATQPQQNPQPVAQPVEEKTKSSGKKYSAPKGSGELVQSSTPEGEMDKRVKPKGAKEIFGNLYYPDSSDFKQRLKEADLNGTNQKEKSAVIKMVLEEVERIRRNYKHSGFGVAETSLDKLERIIDSIEGKNGTSKDVIKRINALRDEIKQYRDRKVTYKESTEKDNINELSSDDGSDISEEGSKTRNQEVDYPNNTKTRNMMGDIGRSITDSKEKNATIGKLQTLYDNILKSEGISLEYVKELYSKDNIVLDVRDPKVEKFLRAHMKANDSVWKKFKKKGGFFKSLDGRWKFWFSDDAMKFKIPLEDLRGLVKKLKKGKTFETTLGKLIDHDLLFRYYPELKDMPVIFKDIESGAYGEYDHEENLINIDKQKLLEKEDGMTGEIISDAVISERLLHEIQHAIQEIEGFARGGSDSDFFNYEQELDYVANIVRKGLQYKAKKNKDSMAKRILNSKTGLKDLIKESLRRQFEGEVPNRSYSQNQVDYIREEVIGWGGIYNDFLHYTQLLGEIEARFTGQEFRVSKKYKGKTPTSSNISESLGDDTEEWLKDYSEDPDEYYDGKAPIFIRNDRAKSRNMEVDTIPETPVEQNRDVYSITFTKDALAESEENRKRAKNYESEDKYWKKEKNADGSVTFTRQKPQPHHTKTITYSGMHGKEVSKKPLTTVSEGLSKAWDYWKEKAYNVQASIKDLAEMVGAPESWMEFVVTKDMGSLAQTAIERGIVKHNSKDKERTVALMDIANAFKGEKEQWNFINYCVAYRVLHDLTPKGIEQKMKPNEARDIIRQVESSPDAAKYKEWREKFTEYNKELLHVLVDGNMITEQEYQTLIKEHPNFIPLSKDMSDFDGAMDFLHTHRDLINVQSPLHRIGTSMKEIKNPIIEMQKRTFDYYQRAAQNKAALVFIDKIVNKITTLANGDEVMLNQAILHKLKPQYNKNGTIKDISDANKGIFYVMRDGKKEFYQLSDASVYHALRAMSPQHMEGFGKFVDFVARKPSQLLRTMATITFDFALGNLVRDTGEAFVTSRHGFVPFYDSLWGMWQMYNDTQWFKEYNSQVGDMTSRLKEDKRIAGVEQSIEDQLMRIPVLGHMALAMKVFNEYMEQGTRIGEYKNARMGYKGLAGRLSKDGVGWITDKDLQKAEKSQTYAAYRAKDITLNFLQRGEWGGWLNRYTTFLNAAMQGQYKIIDTLSEIKNNREGFRNEMLLKASLIAFLGFMTGYNGGDDDDYEEAPDWERDNYYVQGNGLRTPKDQLFGKLIGNPFEQLGYMMKKGKLKNDAFKTFEGSIKEFLLPDNLTPVFINLWLGLSGGKDSFKGKQIVPEYMKEKIGYLQKDLSTSNMAADISRFTYDFFGVDVSAKKLDWGLKQFMSNTAKYVDKIYDTGREEITGQKSNRSGHMYLEEDSKGASDYLNFTTGNNILDGILDLGRMAFGKKFIQNQTTFDSMQDFNEEYLRLKRLSSDEERFTKEDEKKYKTFYEPAFKKIKENYQKLSAISKDSSLDPDKKTEKQRPIVKQSIDLARWALKNGGK